VIQKKTTSTTDRESSSNKFPLKNRFLLKVKRLQDARGRGGLYANEGLLERETMGGKERR